MACAVAGMALAADDQQPDGSVNSVIQAATGKKKLKWTDVFDKKPGKDMYFKIYQQTLVEPEAIALKTSAQRFGMKQSEVNAIARGDISPIYLRNSKITVDQALTKMQDLNRQHQEQVAIETLRKEIEAQIQPGEMFANGNTDDSGFDLLVDLYRIEKILFDETIPVDVGGNQLNSGGTNGGGAGNNSANNPNSGSNVAPNNPNQPQNGGSKNETPNSGEPQTKVAPADNPSICFADPKLEKALDDLNKNAQNDSRLKNRQATTDNNTNNSSPPTDNNRNATDPNSSANSDQTLQPPPAGQWGEPQLCNGVLCVQIDAKFTESKPVPRKADCVMCHLKAINGSMKDLLSKSLLPGKLTGNLAEPAKCKAAAANAFTSTNIQVFAIPKPVPAPQYNGVMESNIDDSWNEFTSRYLGEGKKTAKQQKKEASSADVKDLQDQLTQKIIQDSSGADNLDTVYEKINNSLAQIEQERQKNLRNLNTANQVNKAIEHHQAVLKELNVFLSYFQSFKAVFGELRNPCKSLNNKKECP